MEFENLPFSTIVENYKIDYFLFYSACYCITILMIFLYNISFHCDYYIIIIMIRLYIIMIILIIITRINYNIIIIIIIYYNNKYLARHIVQLMMFNFNPSHHII